MHNISRFPRVRRVPARRFDGPWDPKQRAKASPLWIKATLAFVGAVVAAQIGVWQYRDYQAAKSDLDIQVAQLFAPPSEIAAQLGSSVSPTGDREIASFGFCHEGGGTNCVVDGDTIYYHGTKIRIADIDTPETHEPRCGEEAALGAKATQRLHALVNAGPFTLQQIDRDEDVYGRKLRILTRGGESLGETLVDEGLARWYEGGRQPWC